MNKDELKQLPFAQAPLLIYRMIRRAWWHARGRWRLFKTIRRRGEIWLELGSGPKNGKGHWVTIDMNGQCDIYHNLAKGIPFPAGSVSRIYSSHFFEHLAPTEACACIAECLRVLQQDGEFSIAVPNARLYVENYLLGTKIGIEIKARTPMDFLRFIAYADGQHKNMFDTESLLDLLADNGLANVSSRPFDKDIDLAVRDWETIYAIGYKP